MGKRMVRGREETELDPNDVFVSAQQIHRAQIAAGPMVEDAVQQGEMG